MDISLPRAKSSGKSNSCLFRQLAFNIIFPYFSHRVEQVIRILRFRKVIGGGARFKENAGMLTVCWQVHSEL